MTVEVMLYFETFSLPSSQMELVSAVSQTLRAIFSLPADEMGLGKTVEVLACIMAHKYDGPEFKLPEVLHYFSSQKYQATFFFSLRLPLLH